MGTAGSIILGIVIALVGIGLIVLIVRLIIAFAKVFLFLAIIVAIIMGIYYLVKWLPYAWETYVMSDIGKTIILLAIIGIVTAIVLKKALRRVWEKRRVEKNKKLFEREFAAGRLNITGRSVIPHGGLACVSEPPSNIEDVEKEKPAWYANLSPKEIEEIEWYDSIPNFRGH